MSFKKFISESNEVIKYALGKLNIKNESYTLTEPAKDEFGDLKLQRCILADKELQKSPYAIASMLVEQYPQFRNGKNPESQSYVSSVVAREWIYYILRQTLP